MNSKNPFFKSDIFNSNKVHDAVIMDQYQTMTVAGTINKSFIYTRGGRMTQYAFIVVSICLLYISAFIGSRK